jgi:SSS family solute:Na+ symporter
MDRMLHRGAYSKIKAEVGDPAIPHPSRKINWGRIIGYDDDFTLGDKWLAGGLLIWTCIWFIVFSVGTIWNLWHPWAISTWSTYYHVTAIGIPVFFAITIGVWFTWGGISDAIALFKRLRTERVNPLDNGAVVNHQNLDEAVLPDAESPLHSEPEKPPLK